MDGLHYFIPYFKEQGIRDVYRITRIRTITGKEAKQIKEDSVNTNDLHLAFELEFSHRLSDEFLPIRTKGLINYTFIDTTFDNLTVLPS